VVPSTKKAAIAASSHPAKSKAGKKSRALVNGDDQTGIMSIMKAASTVEAMSGPAKRKAAAVNKTAATTTLKKTKANIKSTLPKATTGRCPHQMRWTWISSRPPRREYGRIE
jgi:hypothetical protein